MTDTKAELVIGEEQFELREKLNEETLPDLFTKLSETSKQITMSLALQKVKEIKNFAYYLECLESWMDKKDFTEFYDKIKKDVIEVLVEEEIK